MKYCTGCEQNLPEDQFAKNSKKTSGLQTYCRSCKKKMDAAYYQGNREAQRERVVANVEKLKQLVMEYKQSRGCRYCLENDYVALDFHHRDGSEKEANISRMVWDGLSKKLITEIAKCEVVCSNCHRKLHAGRQLNERLANIRSDVPDS